MMYYNVVADSKEVRDQLNFYIIHLHDIPITIIQTLKKLLDLIKAHNQI